MSRQRTLDEYQRGNNSGSYRQQRQPTSSPTAARSTRRRLQRRVQSSSSEPSSDDCDVREMAFESPSTSRVPEEEEPLEPLGLHSPMRRRVVKRQRAPTTPLSGGSEPELSEDDSDENLARTSGTRKSTKRTLKDSDDDSTTRRRKVVRGQTREDSEEEEDLMAEVDSELIIEHTLRNKPTKSIFQSKLEEIKRRRRGEKAEASSDQESRDDRSESLSDHSGVLPSARPFGETLPDFDDNGDDEDEFIEHDSDIEVQVELPAQFSRQSHQDMNMHFKVVCQLLVHLATLSGPQRESFLDDNPQEEYFNTSLNAVSRKLGGLKDSLVQSSVWKEPFTKALKAFPNFELHSLDYAESLCDACRISGRVATFSGVCSGIPYLSTTFEPKQEITHDSDDEAESDDQADRAPDQFYLGRFCAARARVFHSFTHWKFHLFSSLKSEVDGLRFGYEAQSGQSRLRVSIGSDINPPANTKDADAITDWLDTRDIIQAEWRKIKKLMERAHRLESHKGRDDDDIEV